MGLRQNFSQTLKDAMKAKDVRTVSTIRLVQAALKDRDIANRSAGKDPVSDDEILTILAKMIRQREESVRLYEEGARLELAQQEREEIAVIEAFMPKKLPQETVEQLCASVVKETGAQGLRDMGKCMNVLKERYPGQMDFSKASGMVRDMLR